MNKYLILGLALVFAFLLVLPGALADPTDPKYENIKEVDDHPWGGNSNSCPGSLVIPVGNGYPWNDSTA